MSTTLLSKKTLVKFIAVVAAVALVFGIAPVLGFSDISLSASAETPVYDPALGSYTTETDASGNTVLTATPNEACGFRGWFLEDGTEVSYNAAYTLPSGAFLYFIISTLLKKVALRNIPITKALKQVFPRMKFGKVLPMARLWAQAQTGPH